MEFQDLINEDLKGEEKKRRIGRYYPSEIGYCLRKVYMSYLKPQQFDDNVLRIFKIGDIYHDYAATLLEGKSEEPFELIFDGFSIGGRVDFLRESDVIEFKTTKSLKYVTEPQKAHVFQLMTYLKFFNMSHGFLVYIEKSTLKAKTFKILFDKEVYDEAIGRVKMLHGSLESGIEPLPEVSWACRYCPYKKDCKTIGVESV